MLNTTDKEIELLMSTLHESFYFMVRDTPELAHRALKETLMPVAWENVRKLNESGYQFMAARLEERLMKITGTAFAS